MGAQERWNAVQMTHATSWQWYWSLSKVSIHLPSLPFFGAILKSLDSSVCFCLWDRFVWAFWIWEGLPEKNCTKCCYIQYLWQHQHPKPLWLTHSTPKTTNCYDSLSRCTMSTTNLMNGPVAVKQETIFIVQLKCTNSIGASSKSVMTFLLHLGRVLHIWHSHHHIFSSLGDLYCFKI